MKIKFDVTHKELHIIQDVFAKHLCDDCNVWVFGSRAKNTALFNSDLDLAIECKDKIDLNKLNKIKSDLEFSRLPYTVDLIDINAIKPHFKDLIQSEMIAFPLNKNSNIPKLRFKEFEGEWLTTNIGSILTIGSGRDYKHLKRGDIPVFGTGGYMLSVNDYLYDGESVCIGRKGTIDKPYFMSCKFWTVDTLFYTHDFNNSIPRFVFNIFQRINWQDYNEASGVPSLSKKTIEKIKVNIPTKPEQQKIASFLTSVDKKIELLTQKEKLLKDYKKSIMQKIFRQEIRFKADDGSEFPEWVEKRLGNYLTHKSDRNKNFDYSLVLSVSNKKGFITQDEQFDGYEVASKDLSNYKIVNKNNYAYNPSRINVGSIARLKNIDQGIVSPMYVVFKIKETLNNLFFDNLIQTHLFKHLVIVNCSGSVRDSLSFDDMCSFKFKLPCLEEQTKIANFLSSIDSKIEQVIKQLEHTKEFKKGLLQQMFV